MVGGFVIGMEAAAVEAAVGAGVHIQVVVEGLAQVVVEVLTLLAVVVVLTLLVVVEVLTRLVVVEVLTLLVVVLRLRAPR